MAMSAAVMAVALWSSTAHGSLDTRQLERLGLSGVHISEGRWLHVVTSVFITGGRASFWSSWMQLMLFVGLAERRWGARTAAGLFWGGHVWAVAIVSLGSAALFHQFGSEVGLVLFTATDVGPSAGYWACAGGALAGFARRPRRWAVWLVVAGLSAAALYASGNVDTAPHRMVAAMAHLVAFLSASLVVCAVNEGRSPSDHLRV